MENNETDNSVMNDILNEMFQAKVWDEVMSSWAKLPMDEQESILNEFAEIVSEHGEGSSELFAFFDRLSKKYSKTYYFIHSVNITDERWDDALKDLS